MRRLLLPQPPLAARYLVRGLVLWLLVRLAYELVRLSADVPPRRDIPVATLVVLACVGAGYADLLRRRELVLLGNLAVSTTAVLAVLAASAVAGELALRLLVGPS